MTTTMTIYLFNSDSARKQQDDSSQQDELHRIYKKWRIETCVIGSKLHAYFPDPQYECDMAIHQKWKMFSERLTAYCESRTDTPYKNAADHLLRDKEALFEEKARIIEELLHSKIRWISPRRNRQRGRSDGTSLGSTSIHQ